MESKQLRYFLLFATLIVYLWMTCFFMPFPADFEDSYIMHRYTQNGVDGFLYEWNKHSNAVQGTTGVAWVTIITLLARLTKLNVVFVNTYAGLIFAILTLLVIYVTALRNLDSRNRWIAVCPLIPIISSPFFIRNSANGLETSITLFFVALSIYLLKLCRPSPREAVALGVFSGFTVLVRPDLPLFPVSLFLCAIVFSNADKTSRAKSCVVFLLGTAFSALISLTLAKIGTGTALPLAASLKVALSDMLLGRLPGSQYNYIFGYQFEFLAYLLPLLMLGLISLNFLGLSRSSRYIPIYGACAIYFAYLFTVLPIMDVAFRFQLPLLIGMSFAIVHFSEFILKSGIAQNRGRWLIFSIALLLAFGNTSSLFSGKKEARMLKADHSDFAQIGKELSKIDGAIIASPEAGKLAAFSGDRFFDTVGLNDRFVAENKNKPNYPALLSDYLQNTFGMPDVYIRKTMTLDPDYTFLEIMPDFKNRYVCNNPHNADLTGKVVCVYKASPYAKDIVSSIAPSGIEIALP